MLEQLASPWWAFILIGLIAGVLSGALGVGSGIILVPALGLLFLLPQKSAQGTALAVMAPMALFGAFRYWQNPAVTINPAIVGLLVLGAVVGALVGTEIAARVPGAALKKVFALFIIMVAVRMLVVPPKRPATPAGNAPAAAPASSETEGNVDE